MPTFTAVKLPRLSSETPPSSTPALRSAWWTVSQQARQLASDGARGMATKTSPLSSSSSLVSLRRLQHRWTAAGGKNIPAVPFNEAESERVRQIIYTPFHAGGKRKPAGGGLGLAASRAA